VLQAWARAELYLTASPSKACHSVISPSSLQLLALLCAFDIRNSLSGCVLGGGVQNFFDLHTTFCIEA
jgi:hypothetical protein